MGRPGVGDFPIVALVCSAGGLEALSRVLEPLPADLPQRSCCSTWRPTTPV